MKSEINANETIQAGSPGDGRSVLGGQVMCPAHKTSSGKHGHVRAIILPVIFFLAGLGIGTFCLSRKTPMEHAAQVAQPPPVDRAAVIHEPAGVKKADPIRPSAPTADPAALEAVKRAIPNVASTSVETGNRILRKAAVAEFEQATRELRALQKEAEQDLNKLSEEQQKGAAAQLRERQARQMAKLEQIAADSKAQIDAFQQLKEAAK
jgi:hypothetical protein